MALRRAPPSHVVVDNSIVDLCGEPSRLADFVELFDIVTRCYRFDADFSTIVVYRLSREMPTCSLPLPTDVR